MKVKTTSNIAYNKPITALGNWIAYDMEWELDAGELLQDYLKILTFGYEDVYGNKGSFDVSDFNNYPNPSRALIEAIKNKLLKYEYCFAWSSKAIKHKNEKNGKIEGINGDLVVLDSNFRNNGISSIVKYDKISGIPLYQKSFREQQPTYNKGYRFA